MANFDTSNAKFNSEIRKLEITDPCHADTFNNVFRTLINNDVALNSQNVDIAKQSLKQVSGTYVGNNSAQNIKIGITPSFIFISDKECKQFSITFKDFTVIFEDGKTPYMTITQIGCSIDYINLGSVMSDKGKIYNYYAIGQGEN